MVGTMNPGFVLLFHTESRAEYSAQMSTDLKEAEFSGYMRSLFLFFFCREIHTEPHLPTIII